MDADNIYGDAMKEFKRLSMLFTVGGVGYAFIEILWRGRTHWSMCIAGGLCFIVFSEVSKRMRDKPLVLKAFICALFVTLIELAFGLIFNMLLGMRVWDYSGMLLNLWGQICPAFSVVWVWLAIAFIPLADRLNKRVFKCE